MILPYERTYLRKRMISTDVRVCMAATISLLLSVQLMQRSMECFSINHRSIYEKQISRGSMVLSTETLYISVNSNGLSMTLLMTETYRAAGRKF